MPSSKRKLLKKIFKKIGFVLRHFFLICIVFSILLQSNINYPRSVFAQNISQTATNSAIPSSVVPLTFGSTQSAGIVSKNASRAGSLMRESNLALTPVPNSSASIRGKTRGFISKRNFQYKEKIEFELRDAIPGRFKVRVIDRYGKTLNTRISEKDLSEKINISIEQPENFRPGKYKIEIVENGEVTSSQDFTWGVLAVNTDKSIYSPKETADIAMGVLDETGAIVCNAKVILSITDPNGNETELSTENGKIRINSVCGQKTFTLTPDYQTEYGIGVVEGEYSMKLTAESKNGSYSVNDKFQVKENPNFSVKRIAPTRIFPALSYPVKMEIKANIDFEGRVTEIVPSSFDVFESSESAGIKIESVKTISSKSVSSQAVLGAMTSLPLPFKGEREITLSFGEQLDLIDPELKGTYKNFNLEGHDGIDFDTPEDTPVNTIDDGEVIIADENGDYGGTIVLKHSWGKTYYGHLSALKVEVGQKVSKEDVIGLSGSTGFTTGPHLHFGIKLNDADENNGYYGKIDPAPLLGLSSGRVLGASTDLQQREYKIITWNVKAKKGEEFNLEYRFKAPGRSPEFYVLGPAGFIENDKTIFEERREWQIAVDAMPAFKAAGAFTSGTGALNPVPYPTGGNAPAAGDIALLVVSSENQTISLTTANGFVELGDQANKAAGSAATNPGSRLAVFWKRCVGGDTAPVVADSINNTEGQIFLFSGVKTTGNPWNIYAEGNDTAANDQSGVIPGAETTVPNALVVLISSSSYNATSTTEFANVGDGGGWANANLASITEIGDNTNTAGLGGGFGVATGQKAAAGTYADTTVTLAHTSYKGAMSIALVGQDSPSVVLNTPTDTATSVSTTPDLVFTGTDNDGDTIEYNVQVDTQNDFNSGGDGPLLSKFSVTPDATFTDLTDGSDTHPFDSGDQIKYTVQAGDALAQNTTYYWRVRAIDPSGSNTYGAWSAGGGSGYNSFTTVSSFTLSGNIYTDEGSSAYLCNTTGNLTVNLRVNGAGSYTANCTADTGAWSIGSVTVASGQTVVIYLSGGSVRGSTVLISNATTKSDVHIFQDRVILRDDVNGSVTNGEINSGQVAGTTDDLITTTATTLTVASTYETHIYAGDTYAPGGDVTTGKLHIPATSVYTGASETLTLTGSGTGTSRPLYNQNTFTASSNTTKFTGTSNSDIEVTTYNVLELSPSGAGGPTFTLSSGTTTANSNVTIGDGTNAVTVTTNTNNPTVNITGNLEVKASATLSGSGTGTITVNGNVTGAGTVNLTAGTLEQRALSPTLDFGSSAGTNDWTFNNLKFSNNAPAETVTYNSGSSQDDQAQAIAKDSSGNIYVGGKQTTGSNWAIRKYSSSGILDTNFGTAGMVTYNGGTYSRVYSITIDGSNNIYAAGITGSATYDWTIRKYNSSGVLCDGGGACSAWGDSGTGMIIENATSTDTARAITIDGSNNIYVAGTKNGSFDDWAIRKYDSSGALDTSFGTSGTVTYSSSAYDTPYAITKDGSNNIYVAGTGNASFRVHKYNSDGVLCNGVGACSAWGDGGSGMVTSSGTAYSITIDGSTNIYVAGQAGNNWAIRKYDSGGVLVSGFGSSGTVTYDSGNGTDFAQGITIDGSNNIYVAGYEATNGTDWAIRKYNSDGVLCNGVGACSAWGDSSSGMTTYDSGNGADYAQGITIDGSTNIYVAGYEATNGKDWAIRKYDSSGVSAFGGSDSTVTTSSIGSGDIIISGTLTVGIASDSMNTIINNNTYDRIFDINGSMDITSKGEFQAASGTTSFTVAGNFTNNGTFTHSSGTITFDGAGVSNITYSANTTFYKLTSITSGKQLKFDSAQTTIIGSGGTLTIQGTNCTTGRVFLDPETDGNDWAITTTGATVDIDYADVEDSTANNAITAENSTADNGGNNGSWTINAGSCGVGSPTLPQLMKHGKWFNSGAKQPFTF